VTDLRAPLECGEGLDITGARHALEHCAGCCGGGGFAITDDDYDGGDDEGDDDDDLASHRSPEDERALGADRRV
jgi:hypothetical protein